jgi:hypothetical protein
MEQFKHQTEGREHEERPPAESLVPLRIARSLCVLSLAARGRALFGSIRLSHRSRFGWTGSILRQLSVRMTAAENAGRRLEPAAAGIGKTLG